MIYQGCEPSQFWTGVAGLISYTVLEYWLGRTTRTKAGSLMEVVVLTLIAVAGGIAFRWNYMKESKDE